MIQQLALHKQQTIKVTRVQDLDPTSCTDNDYESVLSHEMTVIEPSEIPSRTLTWKPVPFLSHIKYRSNDDHRSLNGNLLSALVWVCQIRFSLDRISSANVTLLLLTLLGINCRLVKQSQQILRFTIGLFINWGRFLVPWDTGLKFITLQL